VRAMSLVLIYSEPESLNVPRTCRYAIVTVSHR